MNGEKAEFGTNRRLKQSNLYYLTYVVLLAAIAVYVSLVLYNYGYLPLRFRLPGAALAYVSYNSIMFPPGFLRTQGLYALLKCIAIVGVSVWGVVGLARESRSSGVALYVLAGLALVDLVGPIIAMIRSANYLMVSRDVSLFVVLRQYGIMWFYVAISLLVCATALGCAFALLRYFSGRAAAPAPPKKEITGIGGWMVLCAIRCLLMPLNYLGSLALVALGFIGARALLAGPNGPLVYLNMELVLLIVLVAALSLVVLVKLFQKGFAFKPLAMALEGATIAINGLTIIYLSIGSNGQVLRHAGTYSWTVASTIGMIVVSALFIAYYAKSDRVKNTFQKSLWSEPVAD